MGVKATLTDKQHAVKNAAIRRYAARNPAENGAFYTIRHQSPWLPLVVHALVVEAAHRDGHPVPAYSVTREATRRWVLLVI